MKRVICLCLILGSLLTILSGCGREEEEAGSNEPIVNLRAIVLGSEPAVGMDELYAQLDALTIPELNCTLRFDFIPWGNEREQLNLAIASNEYDFIPGGVFSDYRTLVSKNAFLNINDYLSLVPDLQAHYATYNVNTLKDCEIEGGLYGIPQFSPGEIKNINEGFFYREDLRKQWGLLEITDLDTMEAYLYRAKEEMQYQNEPLITDNRIWQSLWLLITKGRYIEVNSMQETPFVVVAAEDPYTVLNRLETPEFLEVLSYIRKWMNDGILASNLLSMSDNEGESGRILMTQDKKPCETNVPIWSASGGHIFDLTENHPEWEYGFFPYCSVNEEWYASSLSSVSVISISAKTIAPETAVKLLEKIHTDQRYYDLMKYGVEGIHYILEDEKIFYEGLSGDRFTWSVCTDELLNRDNVPINEQWSEVLASVGAWQDEISKVALSDPLDGFAFSTKEISEDVNAIERIRLQYFQPLVCGLVEDYITELQELSKSMLDAGLKNYIEELQKQINEWRDVQ